MSKHKIILLSALALAAFIAYQTHGINNDLQDRFPDVPAKDLKKAYLQFLKNSTQNKYGPMNDLSDEEMDILFRLELEDLNK